MLTRPTARSLDTFRQATYDQVLGRRKDTLCDLLDAVVTKAVRHTAQEEITEALKEAAVKTVGDGWRWTRSKSMRPISALVSITYARQMLAALLPDLAYDPFAALRDGNGLTREAG